MIANKNDGLSKKCYTGASFFLLIQADDDKFATQGFPPFIVISANQHLRQFEIVLTLLQKIIQKKMIYTLFLIIFPP